MQTKQYSLCLYVDLVLMLFSSFFGGMLYSNVDFNYIHSRITLEIFLQGSNTQECVLRCSNFFGLFFY